MPAPTLTPVCRHTWSTVTCACQLPRICRRCRYKDSNKSKPADYWEDIPMNERRMMIEGTPVLPTMTPEDKIQRKNAILKGNFCAYVQKMHQDKNAPFVAEYQVLWTPTALMGSYRMSHVCILYRLLGVQPHTHRTRPRMSCVSRCNHRCLCWHAQSQNYVQGVTCVVPACLHPMDCEIAQY